MEPEDAVTSLYQRLIAGWNAGDSEAMSARMTAS
jgi:hypothetical protein